jgi:hypothetical protein
MSQPPHHQRRNAQQDRWIKYSKKQQKIRKNPTIPHTGRVRLRD